MRDEDFEQLYDEHAARLLNFLYYRTGDRALAEDLMAEAFERALRGRRRFNPRKGSPSTWLYTIALNCLRDHNRRRAVEERAIEQVREPGDESEEPNVAEVVERRATVSAGLEALSPEEREAIALRFGADLSFPEIAAVSDEPLTTIEARVYRALRKLRDLLEE